jgi:hypothetical protein
MKKNNPHMTVHKILVVCVCFVICVRVAIASQTQQPANAQQAASRSPQLSDNQPKKIEFTSKGVGELTTEKGVSLSFTTFEASDGVRLTVISREFDSPERAKQELDKGIAKAVKIIERGVKRNTAGRIVGNRVHVLLSSGSSDHPTSALLWTQGRYFHEITSASWTDILELEKRYSD